MKEIKFLNEKGNPIPSVRADIASQVMNEVVNSIKENEKIGSLITKESNKQIVLHLANDTGGVPIIAKLDLVVTTYSPKEEAEKPEAVVEKVDLF